MSHTEIPISDKQLAANRANAARSTGPRTPEGKARSACNSRKHGFTAANFAVVRLEDLRAIAHLKADLVATYQPVNSQELFAIERIALAQQGLLRAAALESGLFTTCLDKVMSRDGGDYILMEEDLVGDLQVTRAQNRNYILAEGFHRTIRASNSWSLFLRYQAQAERHYRRAIEEFERLKRLRKELPNEPILEAEPEEIGPLMKDETNPSVRPDFASDAPGGPAGGTSVPNLTAGEGAPVSDPVTSDGASVPNHAANDAAPTPTSTPAESQAAPEPPPASIPPSPRNPSSINENPRTEECP